MSAPKVKVPGPSAEEKALQAQQAENLKLQQQIIEDQRAQNAILLPFVMEQQGFDVQTDENGNITGISKIDDPLDARRQNIEAMSLERLEKALAGELPVDPALEQSLQEQEETLRNKLTRQFGPGYESSSPAIEAMANFQESAESLRMGARRGEMTLGEQLLLSREQQRMLENQTPLDNMGQWAVQNPFAMAGAHGQTAQGFGQAQVPFIQHRQMQTQASIANAQNKASMLGGIGSLVGSIAGMAFMSDEDIKDISYRIGETKEGIPIYVYTRKDTNEQHIGVLAQDVARIRPDVVGERAGYLTVDYERLTDA